MFRSRSIKLSASLLTVLLFAGVVDSRVQQQQALKSATGFPYPEKLTYRVEWRLVTAGSAIVELQHAASNGWQTNLNLESVGWVTRFYKVLDSYKMISTDKFCGANSTLDAQEGKRHSITQLSFDNNRHKLESDNHDLLKNNDTKKTLDIAPCTHDVMGSLEVLRMSNLEPGKSMTVPITDGKKLASAKIEGQGKDKLTINGASYNTVRYEAYLFDNVLYKRKGRLLVWITEDADRIPVQLRLEMGFPIGNVTVALQKLQKS